MNDKPKLSISEHNVKYLILICVILVGAMLITHPPSIVRLGSTSYPPYPGVPNPNITQANINQTICNPNWTTSSIRPPTTYTNPIKQNLMKQIGATDPTKFELDHIIAITNGGDPTNPKNLALQPYDPRPGAHEKDSVEVYVHKQICSGKITLQEGQSMQANNWLTIYNNTLKNRLGATSPLEEDKDDE